MTRKRFWLRGAALAALAALLAVASGCGQAKAPASSNPVAPGQKSESPARGGQLKVAISADISTLDPHNSALQYDRNALYQIFDSLITQNVDMTFGPGLAESWSTPDAKTLVLKLRSGVKFHDGTPFDAQAAKWNLDRMMNPDNKLAARAELASVQAVDVGEGNTLRLTLKYADASLMARLAERPGMMMSPAAADKWKAQISIHPVGTGPFKFIEWVKGDHIALERNPEYWDPNFPKVDKVLLRPIGDGTQRVIELTSGNVDIVDLLDPKDVALAKSNTKIQTFETATTRFGYIVLNVKRPPLDKQEVRQAIAWSIDRDAIAQTAYLGTAVTAQGPFPKAYGWMDHSPLQSAFAKRDIAKAKDLLAKAGHASGIKFTINVINRPLDIQILEMIKAQAAEAGIAIEIRPMDSTQAIQDANNNVHQATYFTWSGRADPDYQIYAQLVTGSGANAAAYSNPPVDELLNKARASYDPNVRAPLYKQINELLLQDSPWIFTVFPNASGIASKKVQGYVLYPDLTVRLRGVSLAP